MIELLNVSVKYNSGDVALDDVSLKINDGEFIFIVGHSGAGKTTLTKILLGEKRISSGSLKVNGYSLKNIKNSELPFFRRKLGIVFQDFRLIERKTVFENVALPLRIAGNNKSSIRKKVNSLLKLVHLENKKDSFPSQMSGGEQQRVAFIRAIAANPDIIIADEPTGNVDRELASQLFELLELINSKGKTVIVVTHDMELVKKYSHRTITIENGKIISDILPMEAGGNE
jgi:cell division transport system ATP-binding protein